MALVVKSLMERRYREFDNQSCIKMECDTAYLRLIPSLKVRLILDLVLPSQLVLYMSCGDQLCYTLHGGCVLGT